MNEKRKLQMSNFDFIIKELGDAIKAGDYQIIEVVHVDAADNDCEHCIAQEDKKRFETIVDALCCVLIHDNDSASCMYNEWRFNKDRLEHTYECEEEGSVTSEIAEHMRVACRNVMVEFETAFTNVLFEKFHDLLEPMPLQNRDIASVVRGRFIKNYSQTKDDES